MSTTKTTQQLARELADRLHLLDQFKEMRSQALPRTENYPMAISYGRLGVEIPAPQVPKFMETIQTAIQQEAASIKKQLQEALASE